MTRAIKERDQHCQCPGCTHTNHLHIHHIKHWADDGETCVSNGVLLCTAHHLAVHEGGYTLERIDHNKQYIDELFEHQRNKNDIAQFDIEKQLRNDRESFDTVRRLSPTRFRFRVLDNEGRDVRTHHYGANDYTRVYCAEPIALYNVQKAPCHASSSISPIIPNHKQPCCSTAA